MTLPAATARAPAAVARQPFAAPAAAVDRYLLHAPELTSYQHAAIGLQSERATTYTIFNAVNDNLNRSCQLQPTVEKNNGTANKALSHRRRRRNFFSASRRRLRLSSVEKDWKHRSMQKVVTLNTCCDMACLTFHLPHITTDLFRATDDSPQLALFGASNV